jgi:hypothetical protein
MIPNCQSAIDPRGREGRGQKAVFGGCFIPEHSDNYRSTISFYEPPLYQGNLEPSQLKNSPLSAGVSLSITAIN